MTGLCLQQLAPKLVGITPGGRGEFVHEALDDEGVLRRADRAPEAEWNRQIGRDLIHGYIRNAVRHVRGPVDQRSIDAVLQRPELEQDRRRHDVMRPRDRLVLSVEPGGEPVVGRRPIESVLGIVFARPDDLHRCVHRP